MVYAKCDTDALRCKVASWGSLAHIVSFEDTPNVLCNTFPQLVSVLQ